MEDDELAMKTRMKQGEVVSVGGESVETQRSQDDEDSRISSGNSIIEVTSDHRKNCSGGVIG